MKKIADFIFSYKLMAIILILIAVSAALATFIENDFGSQVARERIYAARWFELLLLIFAFNLTGIIFRFKSWKKGKLTVFIFHIAFLVILLGAAITRYLGYEGTIHIREGETNNIMISEGAPIMLPFELKLSAFVLDRYPGSMSPSSYASEVILFDHKENKTIPFRIYMNHILKYKGYRFYQSSYDNDEKGTILSVNHDGPGIFVTYTGYFLLSLGMFLSLFNKKSRFYTLSNTKLKKTGSGVFKNSISVLMLLFFLAAGFTYGQDINIGENQIISKKHANQFASLLIQDKGGRIKPINTFTSDILRKLTGKENIYGLDPNQVYLGMLSNPYFWQGVPLIKVSNPEISIILGISGNIAAYRDFIDNSKGGIYKLTPYIDAAYKKQPAEKTRFDKDIISVDERVNISYMIYTNRFLKIFPGAENENFRWFTPAEAFAHVTSQDSVFVKNIFGLYLQSLHNPIPNDFNGDKDNLLKAIKNYQKQGAGSLYPGKAKISLEILYYKLDFFKRLFPFYLFLGLLLLIIMVIKILYVNLKTGLITKVIVGLLILCFTGHASGLALRWYISGHAPWSNGFESMIYIAWVTMLAGFIFTRKTLIILSGTSILAALALFVAHLSWMNPEITNLVPVLKSYWLTFHVSMITASYSFLALAAILGFLNLILYLLQTEKKHQTIKIKISELTGIAEQTMIVGVYLLTTGTLLGAIWANESWGRYWGWDPKETWTLISIIVYTFILHMRFVPGLKKTFTFNLASLLGYSSILMTYFGVNYYLSGLHSYAGGDPVPIPNLVYYSIAIIFSLAVLAYYNQRKYEVNS
ncbi:MAG: cytochrome c biogenesis protein CcsA [Bacteroidales bacterium]|nr:cytochrome c biogenesis protein CcsA [Bacteroidales bacterium]